MVEENRESEEDGGGLEGQQSAAARVGFAKYGEAIVGGFQIVPDLLLKRQAELKLSATDMVVLLNVLMHWWYPEQKPFPRPATISKRMNVTPRTVQRSLLAMEKLGLLKRESVVGRTYLDPDALVKRLVKMAPSDTDYLVRRERKNTT